MDKCRRENGAQSRPLRGSVGHTAREMGTGELSVAPVRRKSAWDSPLLELVPHAQAVLRVQPFERVLTALQVSLNRRIRVVLVGHVLVPAMMLGEGEEQRLS